MRNYSLPSLVTDHYMSSRVIVKNLSRNCTAEDLRKAVGDLPVTDARIVVTKTGESRRFGFIGFRSEADAQKALKSLSKAYIGTSKITVELALPVGDDKIKKSKPSSPTSQIRTVSAEEEDALLDHGRIHVVNLPHSSTREEIELFFTQFGTVRETHVVMDEDLGRPRGIAFVTFVFPKDAVKAVKEGDMQMFQGRLIRVHPAIEKKKDTEEIKKGDRITDFQAKRLERKKAEASTAIHTWNLLFTSANSAASAIAEQLEGVDRADLLLGSSAKDDVAVKAAIAETEVISQTREWLKNQGISSSAFERSGKSILTANLEHSIARSNDTIVIKHLPADVEVDSLRFMFTRNGETLIKFLLSPSKTVAIAQFADSGSAKRTFTANAFRKYKSVPLYLEWAPLSMFAEPQQEEILEKIETKIIEETEPKTKPAASSITIAEDVETSRLCVRNVAFEATSKDIRKLFSAYGRVVAVRLPTKLSGAGDASTGLRKQHRGFAFVEFTSKAEMAKAFQALQSTHLFGRKLVLEPAAMEDGSVDAARMKAIRREEMAQGTLASESKRRKIEDDTQDNSFEELLD